MENKKDMVYVVTRRGRRVEPQNYSSEEPAKERAAQLVELLKKCSPNCANKVSIVKTRTPNTIC